ncbi:Synaptobrevin [Nesidiocoris tenuis]|uniref:Synaptobrevin n=1 Tax=Nesidiocoris tenuis TaxID=355587 RepID=A0ABN7AKW9_9HEMI|nr:Synaptobrevin [Nesidiocoris tenuis]
MESGRSYGESSRNPRLQETQKQVDEVVGIMRNNIDKVLERDTKLSELDDRVDALNNSAIQFEQHAIKIKRKMWWKNLKFTLILGGIIGLFIIIMIIWIASSSGDSGS